MKKRYLMIAVSRGKKIYRFFSTENDHEALNYAIHKCSFDNWDLQSVWPLGEELVDTLARTEID